MTGLYKVNAAHPKALKKWEVVKKSLKACSLTVTESEENNWIIGRASGVPTFKPKKKPRNKPHDPFIGPPPDYSTSAEDQAFFDETDQLPRFA